MRPEAADAESIARKFHHGDATATREVRLKIRRILRFQRFRFRRSDRRDLEQIVISQLWRATQKPGFDFSGFFGLVEVVTARRCIDFLRTRRQEVQLDAHLGIRDPGRDPLAELVADERSAQAKEAIARLSAPCRELIRLHVVLDKPYRELAELLGRSEGALRVQMHRCIQRARKTMEELKGNRAGL